MDKQHQIETVLSGEICILYRKLTGHDVVLSDCRFLDDDQLALIFEESMTPIENLLLEAGLSSLSRSVRFHVDEIFHNQLSALVQQITKRTVVDVLSQSKLDTKRKAIILILSPIHESKC